MTTVVLLFGILISVGGLMITLKPRYITEKIDNHQDSLGLHVFAIIVRIIFGIALLIAAPDSKYPIVLQISGVLVLLTVLVLTVIGRERFKRLIKWSLDIKLNTQRSLGFIGMLFGTFLLYAVY